MTVTMTVTMTITLTITMTLTITITKMHEVRFNRIKLWEFFYVIIIDKSKIYEKDYPP